MATFVFSAQGKKINPTSGLDASLYARTPSDQLTYTGDDPIVWDRINRERLQRGLPGLAEIGSPRPPDDTGQRESMPGETFTVKGPPGLTEAQARAVFDQQLKAGSLVGLRPGDVVSSASQALGGLSSAAALVGDAVSGIAQGASDLVAGAGSLAKKTLTGITDAVNSLVPDNPIGTADFAKQASALAPISKLGITDVTAAMSQAALTTGQASDIITNAKGVGKYGFDANQLERTGLVKPGTTNYLTSGANTLDSVLKSPTVWTGKDGINSLDNLLASPAKQDGIQQQLMDSGLDQLSSLGVPIDKLSAASLAGTALNAAKNVGDTLAWAKGDALPSDLKSQFDTTVRDGAFAVDFANNKLNGAMKQEVPGEPATDTANRETLDAATSRVVGNDKIPEVKFRRGPDPVTEAELNQRYLNAIIVIDRITAQIPQFNSQAQTAISNNELAKAYDSVAGLERLASQLTEIDSILLDRKTQAAALEPPAPGLVSDIQTVRDTIPEFITEIDTAIARLRERLAAATA